MATATFLTAHRVTLLDSPQGAQLALPQGFFATIVIFQLHFFLMGFVPCLNSALQIHQCVKEVKGAEEVSV